jgi:hypothetical protein
MSVLMCLLATNLFVALQNHYYLVDVNECDYGGIFFLESRISDGEIPEEIRDFLWEHLRNEQKGYLILETLGVEGQRTTHTMSVQPDSQGVWSIYHHRFTLGRSLRKRGRRAWTRQIEIFWPVVERVRLSGEVIPVDEKVWPTEYRLRLADPKQHFEVLL